MLTHVFLKVIDGAFNIDGVAGAEHGKKAEAAKGSQ
jgi:hypothetical protein